MSFRRSTNDIGYECPNGWVINANGECVPPRVNPVDNSGGNVLAVIGTKRPITNWYNPNAPTPTNSGNTGAKSVCANLPQAPNGYKYIETTNGCALTVNYDSNIVTKNPISSLLSALGFGSETATSTTNTTSGNVTGNLSGLLQNKTLVLGGVILAGLYFMSKNKKTPKTYDRTESYKY